MLLTFTRLTLTRSGYSYVIFFNTFYHFAVSDTNLERFIRFQRDFRICMACYKELLKETKRMSLQLIQNDQTEDISNDENEFFSVIRNRIPCDITQKGDE